MCFQLASLSIRRAAWHILWPLKRLLIRLHILESLSLREMSARSPGPDFRVFKQKCKNTTGFDLRSSCNSDAESLQFLKSCLSDHAEEARASCRHSTVAPAGCSRGSELCAP